MQIKVWWPILFVLSIIVTCILIFPSELRLADLLGKSGKTTEAIDAYERILRADPKRLDLRLELTRLFITQGQLAKAVDQIEKAGVENITDLFTLNQLADIYSQIGDRGRTVTALRRAANLAPGDIATQRKLADAYQWNSDTDAAISTYEQLLEQTPDDPEILYKLVSLSLSRYDYQKAAAYLERYMNVNPDDVERRELLGNLYLQLEQREFAAVEYDRILNTEPGNEPVRQRLAEIYLLLGKHDRGVAHYEHLVQQRMLNESYFDRLIVLTENYDPDKATGYYKFRLKLLPNDKVLRGRLYDHYAHLGMTDEAVEQLQLLASNSPQDPTYLSDLAYLYQNTLQPEQAKETFERLLETGFFSRDVFDELKLYYKEEKEFDKLVDLFGRIQTTDLYELDTQREHAYFLTFTEHYPQAIESYENIVRVDRGDAPSRIQLAELHRRTGDELAAYKVVRNGLEKYVPDNVPFLLYSAQLLAEQRRYRESIAVYERLSGLGNGPEPYYGALVSLHLKTGEFDKAAVLHEQLMNANPGDAQLKFDSASLNWLRNRPDEVHRMVHQIRHAHANEPGIGTSIATFYFERSLFPHAIDQLKTNLEHTREDSLNLRMLALSHAWNNQPAEARLALQNYHSIYPNDYYTHYHLGILYHDLEDSGAADMEFEQALGLLLRAVPNKQTRLVRANILAYQGQGQLAVKIYRGLVADFPDDPTILTDYSEGLIILGDYAAADDLLARTLSLHEQDYRAQRLQALSYFKQGRYVEASRQLKSLVADHSTDLGLGIDLSDAQLLAGDWLASKRTLRRLLAEAPDYSPAWQRLRQLRRVQSEAISVDYSYEEQSDNFLRQVANVVFEKAASSLLSLKLLFGRENYSTSTGIFPDEDYEHVGAGVTSSVNSKLRTSAEAKAQWHQDIFQMAGHGTLGWSFDPANSFLLTADINSIWRDPLSAAFFDGRMHRLQTDLNLTLWKNIVLWNRFSQERHYINHSRQFGEAKRAYGQVGYQWPLRPNLLTYYQFYTLNYSYEDPGNSSIIAIPESETTHFLGARVDQQLTGKFYYQVGGSIGLRTSTGAAQYYATAHLEYALLRNLRLRSRFEFGRQNTLTGNEANKIMAVDFFFFH